MKYYFLVLVFFLLAYILPLGLRPMTIPDEYRYAVIPLRMVETGDYTTPRLVGYRYFEKPTLGYYFTVGSYKLFGVNAFSLRLPSALSAGLAALFLMFLLSQITRDNRLSALAGLLYLSCGIIYGVGVFAVLDSQLTMAVAGALTGFFLASEEKKFGGRKLLLEIFTGVMLGMAFWLKGFIGVGIVGVTMAGFMLWEKRFKDIFTLPWIPLIVGCITVAPWAYMIHQAEPDFWRYFIIEEHFVRFFGNVAGKHPEPFWYLWPILLGGMMPAGLFLPASIAGWLKNRSEFFESKLNRFALCGLFLPMILLSFSSGKLATYIMPCYFSLSIIMALGFAKYLRSGGKQITLTVTLRIFGWLLLTVGIAGIVLFFPRYGFYEFGKCWFIGLLAALWGALTAFAPANNWKWQLSGFFTGLGLTIIGVFLFLPMHVFDRKAPGDGLRAGGEVLEIANYPIITNGTMMHAVSFVYGRDDIYLSSTGEVNYGFTYPGVEGRFADPAVAEDIAAIKAQNDTGKVIYIIRSADESDLETEAFENFKYLERHEFRGVLFFVL